MMNTWRIRMETFLSVRQHIARPMKLENHARYMGYNFSAEPRTANGNAGTARAVTPPWCPLQLLSP